MIAVRRRTRPLTLLAATLLLTFCASAALAHGVTGKDAAFIEQVQGVAIGPFLYLGAKHMVTGYDHLLFLSGVFIPLQPGNPWYVVLAKFFPVYHFSHAMLAAYFGLGQSAWQWNDLLVIAAWGVFGALVAVRRFRWEATR